MVALLRESKMMGLWRSMAGLLLPTREWGGGEEEEEDEEEGCSMVMDMAVADWDEHNISIPFIFCELDWFWVWKTEEKGVLLVLILLQNEVVKCYLTL